MLRCQSSCDNVLVCGGKRKSINDMVMNSKQIVTETVMKKEAVSKF